MLPLIPLLLELSTGQFAITRTGKIGGKSLTFPKENRLAVDYKPVRTV